MGRVFVVRNSRSKPGIFVLSYVFRNKIFHAQIASVMNAIFWCPYALNCNSSLAPDTNLCVYYFYFFSRLLTLDCRSKRWHRVLYARRWQNTLLRPTSADRILSVERRIFADASHLLCDTNLQWCSDNFMFLIFSSSSSSSFSSYCFRCSIEGLILPISIHLSVDPPPPLCSWLLLWVLYIFTSTMHFVAATVDAVCQSFGGTATSAPIRPFSTNMPIAGLESPQFLCISIRKLSSVPAYIQDKIFIIKKGVKMGSSFYGTLVIWIGCSLPYTLTKHSPVDGFV